ncbi:S-methyl-5-thioribose-1-phosphate isomerase [Luteimonas terricola]|uniref:Methylthioribose-1-phosphate isomerase n=1 Tax=Luteimonas terricola TaxID=645597 RepID=A0ABQ2EC37_9GAMM|nr:S-methyl-5-thioribose-1-phosphate isomerase [Luteimonas terricola]GGK04833.1 methylthioribose-1-phosphate isomerase [Luteimonas terricola]
MTDAIDYASYDRIRPIRWTGDTLELLDQRRLPFATEYVACADSDAVAEAIHALAVRGAPAIGIAAAWGVVLAGRAIQARDATEAAARLEPALRHLNAARPTAVNLAWALARMRAALALAQAGEGADWRAALEAEARAIETEDLAANRAMGVLGASLIEEGSGVLTHCNTGSLATAGFGTALGVIRAGVAQGRVGRVYAGETRPWNQGARLTVWELQQDGIDATLIADAAASHLMKGGEVQWVVVGADRICANGDVANKIGTYQLAIAARHHGVRFMVVAPSSTVDMAMASGDLIEIEERDPGELLGVAGSRTVAEGVQAWNPVFDVTPAELIDAIVTEKGIVERPHAASMRSLFGGA